MKNIRNFLSENFHFLVVKFSVHLNLVLQGYTLFKNIDCGYLLEPPLSFEQICENIRIFYLKNFFCVCVCVCVCVLKFSVYLNRRVFVVAHKLYESKIQSNLNGSNILGTMKICSRYG